jgi:hypothetical protein
MQKFNLKEVVKVVATSEPKEGIVIEIMTFSRYLEQNIQILGGDDGYARVAQCLATWKKKLDCTHDDITDGALYIISYVKPIRTMTFLDYCNHHKLSSNPESEEKYKEDITPQNLTITCELDLEFVAKNISEFKESFETEEKYCEWIDNYDKVYEFKQG